MSVQFKMIPKQNNLVVPPEVKYYPCAVNTGTLHLNDLAKIISDRSSMTKADCYGVIVALSDVIGEALSDGKIVKIDTIGTFQIYLRGTASETEDALGKINITQAKVSYKPSQELKKRLKQIKYKRIR